MIDYEAKYNEQVAETNRLREALRASAPETTGCGDEVLVRREWLAKTSSELKTFDMPANALGDYIFLLREMLADLSEKPSPSTATSVEGSFQQRVDPWLMECFGLEIARDILERNHRFLEEALELVQANGCTASEAHQLVDYVYGRDQGEINQEVGGVMVTLAALCLASGVDMHEAAETELARVWTKVEKIRSKHFAKPKFSPLPGATPTPSDAMTVDAEELAIWLHNETDHPEHCPGYTWPENEHDDGRREGGFVKIVPKYAQEYFRDIARRMIAGPLSRKERGGAF